MRPPGQDLILPQERLVDRRRDDGRVLAEAEEDREEELQGDDARVSEM